MLLAFVDVSDHDAQQPATGGSEGHAGGTIWRGLHWKSSKSGKDQGEVIRGG